MAGADAEQEDEEEQEEGRGGQEPFTHRVERNLPERGFGADGGRPEKTRGKRRDAPGSARRLRLLALAGGLAFAGRRDAAESRLSQRSCETCAERPTQHELALRSAFCFLFLFLSPSHSWSFLRPLPSSHPPPRLLIPSVQPLLPPPRPHPPRPILLRILLRILGDPCALGPPESIPSRRATQPS